MAWDLLSIDDAESAGILDPFDGGDVHYRPAYLRAIAGEGEGAPMYLSVHEGGHAGVHVFLVRDLAALSFAHDVAGVDLVSPYGYAGPLLSRREPAFIDAFCAAWREAARTLGAASEFVRFHPLLQTHTPFAARIDIESPSGVVFIDLADDIDAGLSLTCRKNVSHARKRGVRVEFASGTAGMARFVPLYRATMRRREASSVYDFGDAYFSAIAEGFGDDARVALATHEGRDIAAALLLRHGPRLHYHLGGSDFDSRALCGTNLVLYEAACRARDEGLATFLLGGGLLPDDSLYKFKAGFSNRRAAFFVGRAIYDAARYARLIGAAGVAADTKYFPAYRAGSNMG